MPAQPSATETRLIRPAEQCQSEIIYLQHPTEPRRLMLLRGSVADTLIRFGYTELTKEQYEAEE